MIIYDDMIDSNKGNFEDFLNALRTYETGIDKEKFEWYKENLYNPVMLYPIVTGVGRVLRNFNTGEIEYGYITIAEYFKNLGVIELLDLFNPDSLIRMQYRTINPLGFIGYQLGEAILISTGHYKPRKEVKYTKGKFCEYEIYYSGSVDTENWRLGNKEIIYKLSNPDKMIIATDVNRWEGTFTGKDNIYSLTDLFLKKNQEKVIRQIIQFNYGIIKNLFRASKLSEIFSSHTAKIHFKNKDYYTASGILAAAHLVGAWGTADFLLKDISAYDEFGTKIEKYLKKFSFYNIDLS